MVRLSGHHIVVGIACGLYVHYLLIDADSVCLVLFVDGVTIDVEAHGVFEVILVVVPFQIHTA